MAKKIAITSPKVQTTRFRITGILNEGENQFVFIDTPGMHKPYHGLGKSMDKSATDALMDADAIMWVVDQTYSVDNELLKSYLLSLISIINSLNFYKTILLR